MNYTTETVILDDTFKELMIERCFGIDQYVIVRNSGQSYAKLHYGVYTYKNPEGEFTEQKNLLQLKRIFKGLITKYKSFEHEGFQYNYYRGSWSRMQTTKP
ncbi:hypothetical protein [Aquimarina aggregata]|uniref:hypothetical protein n=1 Tax=Aquimarina aggregata TaxID=1642818 RepID=UPI002490DF09|nr:hypothetical protein [Aquimarina aggregata]